MRRGDVVLAVLAGDYGKPRPVVIVQSDQIASLDSILVCPISSHAIVAPDVRLAVASADETGLQLPSQIMVEKLTAVRRDKFRERIGRLPPATLRELDGQLAFVLDLGSQSA